MAKIESIEYSRRFLRDISRLPRRVIDDAQKKDAFSRMIRLIPV